MIILFEDRDRGAKKARKSPSKTRSLFGRASWRKARAAADVSDGLLTPEAACERYGIDAEELATWQRAVQSFGLKRRRKSDAADADEPDR